MPKKSEPTLTEMFGIDRTEFLTITVRPVNDRDGLAEWQVIVEERQSHRPQNRYSLSVDHAVNAEEVVRAVLTTLEVLHHRRICGLVDNRSAFVQRIYPLFEELEGQPF